MIGCPFRSQAVTGPDGPVADPALSDGHIGEDNGSPPERESQPYVADSL